MTAWFFCLYFTVFSFDLPRIKHPMDRNTRMYVYDVLMADYVSFKLD